MSAIFEVLVKYGSRELVKLELSDTSTVLDLQEAITETFDVAPEHQKIVFRGKTLSDPNATLKSVGLTNKCKVMLVNSTPPPPPPPPPVPAPVSIPTPFIDFATRQPRARRDEYMTAPPHSGIIARGPPEGAMEGNNYQSTTLPLDPLVVRDSTGDVAKLAFRSDDLVVDSETNHHRIFYQEITSYGIQEIPGHEQRYIALGLQIKGQKLWVYFIPKHVNIYLQGSGRNVNNTTEQDNNYNKLKEIFEKELKQKINKWGWYILCNKSFTSKSYINMEEYVKEVKKLLEYSLAEPVAEFNKIINMFENKM